MSRRDPVAENQRQMVAVAIGMTLATVCTLLIGLSGWAMAIIVLFVLVVAGFAAPKEQP